MFKTVVVPLDGSELAEAVLPYVIELGRQLDSRVVLVRAVDPVPERLGRAPSLVEPPAAMMANVELAEKALAADRREANEYLAGVRSRLVSERLQVDVIVREQGAADAIAAVAAEQGADLIAMSTHGRGGLERLVFGSVADAVLHGAAVPVLIVRPQR